MYSRSHNRDMRVPPNYGGSMFNAQQNAPTPVQDMTRKSPPPPASVPLPPPDYPPYIEKELAEEIPEQAEGHAEETVPVSAHSRDNGSLLSPFGSLGSEELLLLALALIIFQGGKEPDLALILLALLFIS